jgi:probable blue pigment (indigoidine) exporter
MERTSAGPATVLSTVLAPVSWGTTYVTITELLPAGRPLLVAAVRVLPAGLVLLAAGRVRSAAPSWRPRGVEWRGTAVLAAANFAVFLPLLVVAVQRLPGGVAAAAGGLQPLLVAALSWWLVGRVPPPVELAVGLVAATGVALVVVGPGAAFDPVGVLAALAANLSFAAGVVLTRRASAPPNPLAATGWQLTLSGVALAPLAVLVEGLPPAPTVANLAGAAYLTLGATAAAFVLWFRGVRRLPPAAPPLLGLAAPVTGALLGWMLLGESLTATQLAGFVLSIGAIGAGAAWGARVRPPAVRVPSAVAHGVAAR